MSFPAAKVIVGYALLFSVNSALAADQPVADFASDIAPILAMRCQACHGPEKQEASIRFDQLSTDLVNHRDSAQHWLEALNAVNAGEMPPADAPELSAEERKLLTGWITSAIQQAIATQRSTGARVVLRRLNGEEYQHTMRDLLDLEMNYVRDLPPDGISPDGFLNHGRSLRMSAIRLAFNLDTARNALGKVIVSGPPPKVFRHRFEKSNVGGWRGPTEKSNRLERAQKFLVKMVDEYPDQGDFVIRIQARAELKPDKGYPLLEVAVGYRPDTEVHFRVLEVREILSEQLRQYEFRGRIENFPLPVRGQGKYPGLVVRLRNVYDDGTPIPNKIEKITEGEGQRDGFRPEPHLPTLLIESLEFEGPFVTQWPPARHQRILFESALRNTDEEAYLKQVLERFMTRAFRRPAKPEEVLAMVGFAESIRGDHPPLEDVLRETLAMVLIQPDFLYLMEPAGDEKRNLNDWELATRLSYFLWSTMPDERLFELATQGLLQEPNILKAEITRMLADPRAEQFHVGFMQQWLQLDRVGIVSVDQSQFPDFNPAIKRDMEQQSIELFAELLNANQSALGLLNSDFVMLNEPMARHYGVEGIVGQQFRRVSLTEPHRGGLLSHASILLANSNGRESHPIRRAVWIRDRLLGDPPAPPPPDVPDLDEENPEFAKLSLREQLEVHREKESCASCHRNLDAWGIALENFDALGRWRESSDDPPIVAEDRLGDGTVLSGFAGLRQHLVEKRSADFARAFVRNLLCYALGRSLELADQEDVDRLVEAFVANDMLMQDLIHTVITSDSFRTK